MGDETALQALHEIFRAADRFAKSGVWMTGAPAPCSLWISEETLRSLRIYSVDDPALGIVYRAAHGFVNLHLGKRKTTRSIGRLPMGRPRQTPEGSGTTVSVRLSDDQRLYLLAIAMTRGLGGNVSALMRDVLGDFVRDHMGRPDVEKAKEAALQYGFFDATDADRLLGSRVVPIRGEDATRQSD